jgi:hypothetical protein
MRRISLFLTGSVLLLLAACTSTPTSTRIELEVTDAVGEGQRYATKFQRASYRKSPGGLVDIVLESQEPSRVDPTQTITQLVYLRTTWVPIPGRTYMEATQIDSVLHYAMLTPPTGVRYDGAGFISYKPKKGSGDLAGRIESGTMAPAFRMGDAVEPFGPARLVGTFVAEENPREVVRVIQLMETEFTQPIASGQ